MWTILKISHVSDKTISVPTLKLSEIFGHAILKKASAAATESDHPLSTFYMYFRLKGGTVV